MIRGVVDTNVLISGLIWGGSPKKCLDKFRYESNYILLLSPELLHEFRSKLLHKFNVEEKIVTEWVEEFLEYSEKVIPNYTTRICRDPNDNMILDIAKSGKADFIITGDKDLLILKEFENIKIISAKSFLKIKDIIKSYSSSLTSN